MLRIKGILSLLTDTPKILNDASQAVKNNPPANKQPLKGSAQQKKSIPTLLPLYSQRQKKVVLEERSDKRSSSRLAAKNILITRSARNRQPK